MKVDPAASMRCWAVEVELAGHVFTIPAMPAADWWPLLLAQDTSTFLDALMSTKKDVDLDLALLDGTLTGEEVRDVHMDTIEEAAGRSFHAAVVLAAAADAAWPMVSGHLATRGFRWDVMPLGAALDAVYLTMINGLDEEARKKFEAFLDNEAMTTPKSRRRGPDRERVRSEFEQFAGPMPTAGSLSTGVPSDNARPRTRQRPRPPLPDDPSSAPTTPPG